MKKRHAYIYVGVFASLTSLAVTTLSYFDRWVIPTSLPGPWRLVRQVGMILASGGLAGLVTWRVCKGIGVSVDEEQVPTGGTSDDCMAGDVLVEQAEVSAGDAQNAPGGDARIEGGKGKGGIPGGSVIVRGGKYKAGDGGTGKGGDLTIKGGDSE